MIPLKCAVGNTVAPRQIVKMPANMVRTTFRGELLTVRILYSLAGAPSCRCRISGSRCDSVGRALDSVARGGSGGFVCVLRVQPDDDAHWGATAVFDFT